MLCFKCLKSCESVSNAETFISTFILHSSNNIINTYSSQFVKAKKEKSTSKTFVSLLFSLTMTICLLDHLKKIGNLFRKKC